VSCKLDHLHAGFPCSSHHVSRAAASREGDDQIGLSFVKHALVADRSGLAPETVPVGHVDGAGNILVVGPIRQPACWHRVRCLRLAIPRR
jgi:hypothetical protein